MEPAAYFKKFLETAIISYSDQLINNFLDPKDRDVSMIIRGRLYQLKEIIGILDEIDTFDKMKLELIALENEGFVRTPEENVVN